jgi:AraC-like DNA-binding protein
MKQDSLSAMLEAVRIRGSVYFWTSFGPPWGVQVPQFERVVRYHVVLRGHCWVRVDPEGESIRLDTGDMIAIPHGLPHTLSDQPSTPCKTLDRLLQQTHFSGEGAFMLGEQHSGRQTQLVCGHFAHDADAEHPLFRALPTAIVVRGVASSDARWLGDLLQYISREVTANGPGTSAIVTRLSEILFVQTLRSHVAAHPQDTVGWAGFVDPHLGPALARIHESPGTDWSLAALARAAGLSRTRFAVRFRDLMGQTPFEYVARWRMTCAKTELRRLSRSIADTARELGYRSEAAFNRAFTKRYGIGPGAFRRSLQPGAADAAPVGTPERSARGKRSARSARSARSERSARSA